MKRILALAVLVFPWGPGAWAHDEPCRVEILGGSYEGECRNGRTAHGEGVMTWPDGQRYEGEWRVGEYNGRGVMTWPDGTRYEGEWREGDFNGWGLYTIRWDALRG